MDLRKKKIVATLVFPMRDGHVWLARKVRKIGVGLWNGWGGAQEGDETIEETAERECKSEARISFRREDMEYAGVVTFHNQKEDGRKFDVEVHMFRLRRWSGEFRPKRDEMRDPTAWPVDSLPFEEMLPSDKDWLPQVLIGKKIEGHVWHGLGQREIIRPSDIKEVA